MDKDYSNDYELVSRKEVEELRKEIEKIKKNPFGDSKSSKTLLDSMDMLNKSIIRMIQIFESTQEELINEYENGKPLEHMERIEKQNEKIAKGIIAVAELIKKNNKKETKRKIEQPKIPMPNTINNPMTNYPQTNFQQQTQNTNFQQPNLMMNNNQNIQTETFNPTIPNMNNPLNINSPLNTNNNNFNQNIPQNNLNINNKQNLPPMDQLPPPPMPNN